MTSHAIVLLSGGLDSAVCLYWAQRTYDHVSALSFDYGQRHTVELDCAEQIARLCSVERRVITLDLRQFGGSSLTDPTRSVPTADVGAPVAAGIPSTYVPVRNLVFLSLASAWAEAAGAQAIVIGVNAIDYSGYPDCRPAFIEAFGRAAHLASKHAAQGGDPLSVMAPLQHLSKMEIVQLALDMRVPLELTTSCYQPDSRGAPCQRCDSCRIRQSAFAALNVVDPRRVRFGL